MSGWSWFQAAWVLAGELAINLDPTLKIPHRTCLTILSYKADLARVERVRQNTK